MGNFYRKWGYKTGYISKCTSRNFLQSLQKFTSKHGLQVPFLQHTKFCFVLKWRLFEKWPLRNGFFVLDSWSSAPVAYSPIRPKSQNFNIGHDYTLWIRNFMVMMKNPRISILRFGPKTHGHNPARVPKLKYKA
jgi:hypothetical protein